MVLSRLMWGFQNKWDFLEFWCQKQVREALLRDESRADVGMPVPVRLVRIHGVVEMYCLDMLQIAQSTGMGCDLFLIFPLPKSAGESMAGIETKSHFLRLIDEMPDLCQLFQRRSHPVALSGVVFKQ